MIPEIIMGQISRPSVPRSFRQLEANARQAKEELPVHSIEALSEDRIKSLTQTDQGCTDCRGNVYGLVFPWETDLLTQAHKTSANGFDIYRQVIKAAKAKSIQLSFGQFRIPDNAELFVYNKQKTMVLGAFTKDNVASKSGYDLQPVQGEEIVVEYNVPSAQKDKGDLVLRGVAYGFLDIFSMADGNGAAGACNKNVICEMGWQQEAKSEALISFKGLKDGQEVTKTCSGTLVNNTKNDGTPYFLTANHCVLGNYPGRDYSDWVFMFRNHASSCLGDGTDAPTTYSITGATLLASGDERNSSDFALMLLSSQPPASYGACYAGWDKNDNEPVTYMPKTSIHHPRGDVAKISITTNDVWSRKHPQNTTEENYLEVQWANTRGVVEPGSSGGPLFDMNHHIIGQLYGAFWSLPENESNCNSPYLQNKYAYGKFSTSWNDGSLWFFLRPTGTATSLNTYCPNFPSYCSDGILSGNEVRVDCGGNCVPCPPTCTDGVKNGFETGIDCGGADCPACPPSCSDGIRNQGESSIDCGGPCYCQPASCNDHVQNQDEEGIDCGGTSCSPTPCITFCGDGLLNGSEIRTDCGGACVPCPGLVTTDAVSNGSFEYFNCENPTLPNDVRLKYDFFAGGYKCTAGGWYASHGSPIIRIWNGSGNEPIEGAKNYSVLFNAGYATSDAEGKAGLWSDGLYYQLPVALNPAKKYTLVYRTRDGRIMDYTNKMMPSIEFFAAKGLVPSQKPRVNSNGDGYVSDYTAPSGIDKYRIQILENSQSLAPRTRWVRESFSFTVPSGSSYDQLWLHPHLIGNYNSPARWYLDDVVLLEEENCSNFLLYTSSPSVSLSEAAKGITAKDNVKILAGIETQFKAGKYVDLLPGFEATNGSRFKAAIAPCGVSAFRIASEGVEAMDQLDDMNDFNNANEQRGPDEYKEAFSRHEVAPSPNPIKSGFVYFNRMASSYKLCSMAGIAIIEGKNANRLNIDDVAKGLYLLNIDGSVYKILVE